MSSGCRSSGPLWGMPQESGGVMSTPVSVCEPSASSTDIDIVDTVTPAEFNRRYLRRNRPLLMRKMTAHWPAMSKWSFEFFAGLQHCGTVFLEQNNVMQGDVRYVETRYHDYLRQLADGQTDGHAKIGYLSVFKIFRSFPQLKSDVDFSILTSHKVKSTVAGWIGPAGTVTGYHVDWGDNLLAQICGRKEVRLVSPAESHLMYPSRRFDQGTTSSEVDADQYDADRFPLFRKARQRRIVLHPGDMLFIPRGWWHYVRSLDQSISVSCIGYDARGVIVDLLSHRVKQLLHDCGLYSVPCTCHYMRDGKRVRRAVAN